MLLCRAGEPAPAPDFFFKRLRLLFFSQAAPASFFSSGYDSGSKEPKTPISDQLRLLTFFRAAPAPAPGFFSSGSGSGSKEPKTPGSDRLRLRLLTIG